MPTDRAKLKVRILCALLTLALWFAFGVGGGLHQLTHHVHAEQHHHDGEPAPERSEGEGPCLICHSLSAPATAPEPGVAVARALPTVASRLPAVPVFITTGVSWSFCTRGPPSC